MNEQDRFRALVSTWKESYVQVISSYVAIKTQKGTRLYCGKLCFNTWASASDESAFRFETEHIIAGCIARAIDTSTFSSILDFAIGSGKVADVDRDIALAVEGNSQQFSFWLDESGLPMRPQLYLRGASFQALRNIEGFPRHEERELQAADMPFDTLDELLARCGLPNSQRVGDATTLQIVAEPPGLIEGSSQIKGSSGIIECRIAPGMQPAKVRLGWRLIHKNQKIERASIAGDSIEWNDKRRSHAGTFVVPTGGALMLHSYLSYDSVIICDRVLHDAAQILTLRHEVHQTLDPDYSALKDALIGPSAKKGDSFENAVSALLSLFGFGVTHYGGIKSLQDGPDIIAITPSGRIGIFECTTTLPDNNGKIAKLVRRRQLTGARIAGSSGDIIAESLAAIFTPLSREEVKANLALAGNNGVALVCKEQIEQFLGRVALSSDADALFVELKGFVPPSRTDANPFSFPP